VIAANDLSFGLLGHAAIFGTLHCDRLSGPVIYAFDPRWALRAQIR
jgi:hypothetical protein